ncbi:MAG TPA: copper transporter [Tissierellales bacterium]|nr:copper transporter [Tissierellales bacterium]
MSPNIKYYVVTIAAIFLALGIGIYIGFTLDAHNLLIEQKDDIVTKIEEKFDYLNDENKDLKEEVSELEKENNKYNDYIETIYSSVIKDRLKNINVAIVETNDDYVYSGIGKTLELAGANVASITTIKDRYLSEELLEKINNSLPESESIKDNLIEGGVINLTEGIIKGEKNELMQKLRENDAVNFVGNYDIPIDFVIIAGGTESKESNNISQIDKNIIEVAKGLEVPIIGIEKEKVNYSYTEGYKDYRISTVDNVDSTIGKTALILSMEGRPGNYGVKPGAEELLPNLDSNISE